MYFYLLHFLIRETHPIDRVAHWCGEQANMDIQQQCEKIKMY